MTPIPHIIYALYTPQTRQKKIKNVITNRFLRRVIFIPKYPFYFVFLKEIVFFLKNGQVL